MCIINFFDPIWSNLRAYTTHPCCIVLNYKHFMSKNYAQIHTAIKLYPKTQFKFVLLFHQPLHSFFKLVTQAAKHTHTQTHTQTHTPTLISTKIRLMKSQEGASTQREKSLSVIATTKARIESKKNCMYSCRVCAYVWLCVCFLATMELKLKSLSRKFNTPCLWWSFGSVCMCTVLLTVKGSAIKLVERSWFIGATRMAYEKMFFEELEKGCALNGTAQSTHTHTHLLKTDKTEHFERGIVIISMENG